MTITARWEGADYGQVNRTQGDATSVGIMQFTGSSLLAVLKRYKANGGTVSVEKWYDQLGWATLKYSADFIIGMGKAGKEQAMIDAQDSLAIELYWPATAIDDWGLTLPLSIAFAFDTAIQHGTNHIYFSRANARGYKGEKALVTDAINLREQYLTNTLGLKFPGVIPRGKFWRNLVETGDWQLAGVDGILELKPGITVNTKEL